MIAFIATANATLQLHADPAMRGRVMALYGVVFLGSTPLGGALSGWMAEVFGVRSPLWLGGVTSIGIVLVGWARWRRTREPAAAAAVPQTVE
jgi:MFS family permease